jgi:hypothetical protein
MQGAKSAAGWVAQHCARAAESAKAAKSRKAKRAGVKLKAVLAPAFAAENTHLKQPSKST